MIDRPRDHVLSLRPAGARTTPRRAHARGMSLIELMAVVVIIGVLAVLAAVAYSGYVRRSRMAEASHMVEAIRAAQENYFTETGSYLDVSKGLAPPYMYPAATPGPFRTKWGAPCTVCNGGVNDWRRLGVTADKGVYFGYAVVAGTAACDPACKLVSVTIQGVAVDFAALNGGPVAAPWYVIVALADINGNGTFAKVVGHSFSNMMLVENTGE